MKTRVVFIEDDELDEESPVVHPRSEGVRTCELCEEVYPSRAMSPKIQTEGWTLRTRQHSVSGELFDYFRFWKRGLFLSDLVSMDR